METSITALSSCSGRHVRSNACFSEVYQNGLERCSMPSTVDFRLQTFDRRRGSTVVQTILRGRREASVITSLPTFKMNATGGDSSSLLPDRAAVEEATIEHPPGKGGLLEWFRNVVARTTTQHKEMIDNLKRYGVAGILSYGLLNTVYYLGAFLFVWFYVAPSPGGLGFVAAARRFVTIFATVWAGSQVTKLLRAAGALSLAPFVDRGLNWFTERFKFKSRGAAFGFLVGVCFGLAALLFLVITTLWS